MKSEELRSLVAMLRLTPDYTAGAFTGRAGVTGLFALRQSIPYLTLLVGILLTPLVAKPKANARFLPMGYISVLLILHTVSTFSVSRSGLWVFRPMHSYLIGAYLSNTEPFYLAFSVFLTVLGVWVIPYRSAKSFRICTWALAAVYAASLLFELFLQLSAGVCYLSVLSWLGSMVFFYLTYAEFAPLLTPQNRLSLRRES